MKTAFLPPKTNLLSKQYKHFQHPQMVQSWSTTNQIGKFFHDKIYCSVERHTLCYENPEFSGKVD